MTAALSKLFQLTWSHLAQTEALNGGGGLKRTSLSTCSYVVGRRLYRAERNRTPAVAKRVLSSDVDIALIVSRTDTAVSHMAISHNFFS